MKEIKEYFEKIEGKLDEAKKSIIFAKENEQKSKVVYDAYITIAKEKLKVAKAMMEYIFNKVENKYLKNLENVPVGMKEIFYYKKIKLVNKFSEIDSMLKNGGK